jgi:hypothetical protein
MTAIAPIVFIPTASSGGATSYMDPQNAKVYTESASQRKNPFSFQDPLIVQLSLNSFLQKGDLYAAPATDALGNQIASAIKQAHQNSLPPSTPHTASDTVTQGQDAIDALMAQFTAQYQYSINGQFDATYQALAQTVPGQFTTLLKDSRTSEVTQLNTIANSGADAATQQGQSALARLSFATGAAFELQNGVNTPVSPKTATTPASGPPNPVTSAAALNDLVSELQLAVTEFQGSGSTLTSDQSASFLQGAQSLVGTLQSIALAIVPQMASDPTPQYFNTNLYNATHDLTAVEAAIQGLTGGTSSSSSSTTDSSSSSGSGTTGTTLNTTA